MIEKAPDVFVTARLELRRPRAADAAEIFARYASSPDVTRCVGWPRHRTPRDTEDFLAFSASLWNAWPAGPYLIVARDSGAVLGSTGYTFECAASALTGYVLAADAWGKGFASEALAAIVELAPRLGLLDLSALCHPAHAASQRVLDKCGFRRDGMRRVAAAFPNLSMQEADVLCFRRTLAQT